MPPRSLGGRSRSSRLDTLVPTSTMYCVAAVSLAESLRDLVGRQLAGLLHVPDLLREAGEVVGPRQVLRHGLHLRAQADHAQDGDHGEDAHEDDEHHQHDQDDGIGVHAPRLAGGSDGKAPGQAVRRSFGAVSDQGLIFSNSSERAASATSVS